MTMCASQMKSPTLQAHVHVCGIEEHEGDHICMDPTCRRRFYAQHGYAGEKPRKVKKVRPRREFL